MNSSAPRPLLVEIQALRTVAVLLVVLYHLWPGAIRGGYVGVDVFFVISGYLISSHLLREVESSGRVHLRRFWGRRARRLLPASYLTLIVSAVATAIWLPRLRWERAFGEVIASTFYVQNWKLANDAVDYLAAEADPTPVQHFWTLSVEEQFYLVWPVVLGLAVLAGVRKRGGLAIVIGAIVVPSLAYSLWITDHNPSAAYFVTPARAWEFGAGALLALWGTGRVAGSTRGHVALSWAGFAAIGWSGLMYTENTEFPGTAAILPVVGTLAVIVAGAPHRRLSLRPVLALRPVQMIGDISYSMYLWHWPPIVILPVALGRPLGFTERVAILIGTIGVAWLSKKYVEDPVRLREPFGLHRNSLTAVYALGLAAALCVPAALGAHVAREERERETALAEQLSADQPECFGAASMTPEPCDNPDLATMLVPDPSAAADDYIDPPDCFVGPNSTELTSCDLGPVDDPSVPHIVLVGDSHARAILPAFLALADAGQLSITAAFKSSCPWSTLRPTYADTARADACVEWREQLGPWLLAQRETADVVVTTGKSTLFGDTPEEATAGFVAAWTPVAEAGIPVLAIRDNPIHDEDPNNCLVAVDELTAESCAVSRADGLAYFDALSAAAAEVPGAAALDLTEFYCTADLCPSVIGGVNVYRDRHHITATYARTLTPFIRERMIELGLL